MSRKVRRRSPHVRQDQAAAPTDRQLMPDPDFITQRHIVHTIIPAIWRFYDDPENMADFQKWLKERHGGVPCAN